MGLDKHHEDILLSIKPEGIQHGNDGCHFYEDLYISYSSDMKLTVIIDSSGSRLLDTVVNIYKTSKEPFISIQDPSIEIPLKEVYLSQMKRIVSTLNTKLRKIYF